MARVVTACEMSCIGEIVNVVVGLCAVRPGKRRTFACITTWTMIPASRRMSGGIIGRRSSITLDCFDIMTAFSNHRYGGWEVTRGGTVHPRVHVTLASLASFL